MKTSLHSLHSVNMICSLFSIIRSFICFVMKKNQVFFTLHLTIIQKRQCIIGVGCLKVKLYQWNKKNAKPKHETYGYNFNKIADFILFLSLFTYARILLLLI